MTGVQFISPHFTLREVTQSPTALRLGIDNTLPDDKFEAARGVAVNILEPVREAFGQAFSPSSWYRCPALNRAVGSKPTSRHMRGEAVDFELVGVPNVDLARWCAENLEFDQLILEFFDWRDPRAGWVHCSWVPSGRRRDVMTITHSGTVGGLPG